MTGVEQIAIAVVQQDDHFLVGPRDAKQVLGGKWEFPGGKIEPGESAAEAAIRECLEETGLHVHVLAQYPEVLHHYDHRTLQLYFFSCRPAEDSPTPLTPFLWIPRNELNDYAFPAANQSLLALLLAEGNQSR